MKGSVRIPFLIGFLALGGCYMGEFRAAEEMVRQQKFYNAIELYLSFAREHPNHSRAPDAIYEVGNIQLMMLNEPARAMATLRSLVANYPVDDVTLKAQRRVAEISKNHFANYAQAIIDYEKLIHTDPKSEEAPSYHLEIARCYTLLHNYDQANIEYEALLKKYPQYARMDEVLFEKGNNAYIKGDYKGAIEAYRRVETEFPNSSFRIQAIFGVGSAFEEMDAFNEAKAEYERVIKDYPSPRVVEIRIKGLAERQKKKEAIGAGARLR